MEGVHLNLHLLAELLILQFEESDSWLWLSLKTVQVDRLGGKNCLGFNLILTTVGQQIITKSFSLTPSLAMLSL